MSIIIPANSAVAGGYDVDNSVRLNIASSQTLVRTQGTATNLKKFVWSCWIKRSTLGAGQYIVYNYNSGTDQAFFYFRGTDDLRFFNRSGGADTVWVSDTILRDVSAWYHLLIKVDTTQGTDTNRLKIFINGVQDTGNGITYPGLNADMAFNTASASNRHSLASTGDGNNYVGGYFAETVLIDGTSPDYTDFGEFDEDSGIWKPIDVSGLTFGTNGFYLDFENSSALGNDAAGSNNFTVNNLTAIDQTTDSCTNNFATLNPLIIKNFLLPNMYYVETRQGNTVLNGTASTNNGNCYSTIGVNSGKWYVEAKKESGTSGYPYIGIMPEEGLTPASSNVYGLVGYNFTDTVSYETSGNKRINGSTSSYGDTYTTGDIIGIALDCDNGAVYFSKSGTFQNSGNPASGASKTGAALTFTPSKYYFFGFSTFGASGQISVNFGNPSYANSSSVADGNDRGAFEYAPPSGYLSLCTKNLSEVNS